MITTAERNKLVVEAKADAINKRHRGHIMIKTDPKEYEGSVVTIPAVRGCAAMSFVHSFLDDTPGKPVTVVSTESFGGGVRGFADLDDVLQGKTTTKKVTKVENVQKRVEKIIDSADEQALDDFFSSLLG